MVDVEASFVAHGETAKAVQPGKGPLDDPAVTSKLLAGFNAASCDAGLDVPALASLAAPAEVVCFVGMELGRSSSGPAPLAADGRDGIEQLLEGLAVVNIGLSQQEGERDALPVGDEVALGPRPAAVGGVGAGCLPPFWPRWTSCPGRPGSSRADPPGAGGPAVRGAVGPRHRPPANPAAAANTSLRSRTPSLVAASPTGCRSAARRGYQSAQLGCRCADGHLWAWQARLAAKAPPVPVTRGRRRQEGQVCHLTNPFASQYKGFERCSKRTCG